MITILAILIILALADIIISRLQDRSVKKERVLRSVNSLINHDIHLSKTFYQNPRTLVWKRAPR